MPIFPCIIDVIRSSPIPVSIEGLGNFFICPSAPPVKFHENEVPYLKIPVAITANLAIGRPAPDAGSEIIDNLGTRPAGAFITHGPEVVLLAEPHNAVFLNADIFPDMGRIGIIFVNGYP